MNESMTGVSKTILPFIVSGRMSRFLAFPSGVAWNPEKERVESSRP